MMEAWTRRIVERRWAAWLPAAALLAAACGGAGGDGGRRPVPGMSGDTITVGAIAPLSDAVAVIGVPLTAGMKTYFDAQNERGGVGGKHPVRLLVEDQTYANPSSSVQKYQKMKGDVVMLATVVGTDHINTLIPLLEEDSIIATPTTFDAEWVREPNLMPYGPPYQVWAANGVAYYLEQPGNAGKTVCGMALATGYGDTGLEGVRHAAQELGFTVAATVRFKLDDQDFVAPITQLRNAKCDVVMLTSLPSATGKVLGAAAQLGYAPRWIGQGPSWHSSLATSPLADYFSANLWIAFDGPAWGDTTVAGMREMLAALAKFKPDQKPDIYFAAGWVAAQASSALLEKAAALGDFSRAGMLRASESLGLVSFQGTMSDYVYGPADRREPPRTTTIFKVDPAAPGGLAVERADYTSPAAQSFPIVRRERTR